MVIWGAVLQVFILFPRFDHFRLLNVIALFGTTFTAIYMLVVTNQQGYVLDPKLIRLWPVDKGIVSAQQVHDTCILYICN